MNPNNFLIPIKKRTLTLTSTVFNNPTKSFLWKP